MVLTGKCKEAFNTFYAESDECYFNCNKGFEELSETLQNALIIDFFDSVGIYVNSIRYNGRWKPIADYELQEFYNKRPEATNAGIAKANEIFNNR